MAKNKKVEISLEEKLEKALVPVEEQPYKIPDNWVWTRYDVLFSDISKNEKKIEEKNYLENGEIAIVSQGKDRIVGYSNVLEVEPYKEELPLIIFGDHTLNLKYIEFPFYIGADGVKVLKTTDVIIPKFLFYLLNNLKTFSLINTGYRRHYPILKKLFFPLPPLNEQKRIVEKLDFLFEKTKKAKEIIEEIKVDIENRKISILDRAFKGVLTSEWRNENKVSDVKELLKSINDEKIKKWEEECLQAEKEGNKKPKKPIIKEVKGMIVPVEEQPYKLPNSWVWVRLNNLCEVKGGKRIPKGEEFSNEKTKNVYLRVTDFDNYSINQDKLKYISDDLAEKLKNYKISIEDLYLSIAGTIGKVGIIPYELNNSFLTENAVKLTNLSNAINNKFLLNCFKTNFIQNLISNSITSSGQPKLAIFRIENLFIPLPPLEEQQEIIRVLDEVLENENKVKELLEFEERIDILEKSILHKAFKGELGTQNSNDESAMELLKKIL
ncbi:restriction endonuclease subunit S [Fusobacterium nucleatum subsp. nucleatum]|uniref:Restriction endonuclease subunit S n=1 Tax=Fusobacterium nucleatum subsp. nucleatum TaxID=76856 RepID=A0A117MW03_FUSNC|nr:restriction endonuclease subunit S [Fusobacterium nucleatum]KUL97879.1 restriction endonuclease subunit S [Fusobacterium nucleatum subsp. nucleatum]